MPPLAEWDQLQTLLKGDRVKYTPRDIITPILQMQKLRLEGVVT